jgi:hypothetical protein
MFFPPTQRHAPQRNVLPNGSSRDTTAWREIARLSALVEELKRELRTQFTRIADLQAEVDALKQALKRPFANDPIDTPKRPGSSLSQRAAVTRL